MGVLSDQDTAAAPTVNTGWEIQWRKFDGVWKIDAVRFTLADLSQIAVKDYDNDQVPDETMAQELAGLVASGVSVSLSYYDQPFKVDGFGLTP